MITATESILLSFRVSDVSCCLYHSVQLKSCAAGIPHDAVAEDALDGTTVEVERQSLWKLGLPQHFKEKETLLCLLNQI